MLLLYENYSLMINFTPQLGFRSSWLLVEIVLKKKCCKLFPNVNHLYVFFFRFFFQKHFLLSDAN